MSVNNSVMFKDSFERDDGERQNRHCNGLLKKVYHDLDHVEKCGFLHGVQHVLNNIFEVFLDIANF